MTEKWFTIDQIAEYLQASKEKIYKLCQRGKMPASKFGGQWRFDVKEVDAWLRRQRPPTGEAGPAKVRSSRNKS